MYACLIFCLFVCHNHLWIPTWSFLKSFVKVWLDLAEIMLIHNICFLLESSWDTQRKFSWVIPKYLTWFGLDIVDLWNGLLVLLFYCFLFLLFLCVCLNHLEISTGRLFFCLFVCICVCLFVFLFLNNTSSSEEVFQKSLWINDFIWLMYCPFTTLFVCLFVCLFVLIISEKQHKCFLKVF